MLGASYQKNDPKGSNWGGFLLWYSDGTRTNFDRSVTTATRWAAWATEQTNVHTTLDKHWARAGRSRRKPCTASTRKTRRSYS